jgi:beta-glucosidase
MTQNYLHKRQCFLWGVATASYQVEGGITNNDWDYFTRSEEIKARISRLTSPSTFYKGSHLVLLQPAGDAVRFWDPKYYEKDFDLAKSLGLNTFRLKDIPLADPPLSDPYWKSLRGWENNETVKEFIKYVERMVLELKDQVDFWITIGEPVAAIIGGGT